jgi:hypothetical protein
MDNLSDDEVVERCKDIVVDFTNRGMTTDTIEQMKACLERLKASESKHRILTFNIDALAIRLNLPKDTAILGIDSSREDQDNGIVHFTLCNPKFKEVLPGATISPITMEELDYLAGE